MWTIFRVFVEFVAILLLFYASVLWLWGTWDPSSPIRDRTFTPCTGRRSPNHGTTREVPVWMLNRQFLGLRVGGLEWLVVFGYTLGVNKPTMADFRFIKIWKPANKIPEYLTTASHELTSRYQWVRRRDLAYMSRKCDALSICWHMEERPVFWEGEKVAGNFWQE